MSRNSVHSVLLFFEASLQASNSQAWQVLESWLCYIIAAEAMNTYNVLSKAKAPFYGAWLS